MSSLLQKASTKIIKTTSLSCLSSSGARLPRVEGITTYKEYKAIVEAISFAKSLEYPMTIELIQSLSGVKRQSNNKRVSFLIESILELNQLHDDIYTDDNCRVIYKDESGEYIANPDGSIDRSPEKCIVELVKEIEKRKKEVNNKSAYFVEPIVYRDHKLYTFISKLLSSSFISDINDSKMYHNGYSLKKEPVKFYNIRPYKVRVNSFGIDAKYEKHKERLIQHLFSSGLDKNMLFDLRTFAVDIGMLFGYVALKHLPQYRKNLKNSQSISTHGKHLFNMYVATATKNGYIGHRKPAIRFFNEQSLVNWHIDFFKKKKVPKENHYYVVYEPIEILDCIAEEVFTFIKKLNFLEPESKNLSEGINVFSFDFEKMMDIDIRDRMTIMSHSIGVKDGRVWVDIKRIDNQFNRVYSLLTTIKSESRLELNEYDVGTAQQTIMMNVVNDLENYPLHMKLITDKKAFRSEVMGMLGCDYEKAKEHITALSNGRELDYYGANKRNFLKPFYNEARKLSKSFMTIMEKEYPLIYSQARCLAKEAREDNFSVGGKRFYGIIFHAWTYFERQIRDAIKSCFTQPGYDVHDAVYSREKIATEALEKAVLEQTGFHVKIEG